MTSDGISDQDWDRVHELAVGIVNAGDNNDGLVIVLLDYLDSLERRYGELPSIVATRADYIDDLTQRIALLERAYALATARGDVRNCLYCADSLAELYLEDLADAERGAAWLDIERTHLADVGNDVDRRSYEDRRAALDRLTRPPIETDQ